jgi:hypothetical protein
LLEWDDGVYMSVRVAAMWGGEKGKTFFSAYIPSWYNPFTKRAHL